MTINHWQSWTLFYVTKKGDIACIRTNASADKKEMKSKSGRQKTSSIKTEKWKVVQNIKSCLGNLYSLKGKKMLSINNRYITWGIVPKIKTNKLNTTKRKLQVFLINLKKAEGFSFFMWLFQSYIYLCIFLLFYIVSSKACYYIKAHAFIWHYDTPYFISLAEQQSETVLEDSQIFIVITLYTTDQSCFLYLNFMIYISEIHANTFLPVTELWQSKNRIQFFFCIFFFFLQLVTFNVDTRFTLLSWD